MSWRIIDVTQDGRYLHADRDWIGKRAPPEGDVSIMFFIDKQYGLTRNFAGRAVEETEKKAGPIHLVLTMGQLNCSKKILAPHWTARIFLSS